MDWNAVINSVVASGPVAAVAFWGWYRAEQRALRWEDKFFEQSESVLATLTSVGEVLKK